MKPYTPYYERALRGRSLKSNSITDKLYFNDIDSVAKYDAAFENLAS